MKSHLMVASIVAVALAGQPGCQEPTDQLAHVSNAQVHKFPEFLVGTWQTDKSRWRFTFEPDGRVSRLTHYGGMEFDVETGFLTETWRGRIEANFFLGPCEAKYDHDSRQLTVKVVVENFVLDDGVNTMEGNFHDELAGVISENGQSWQVTWTGKGEIVGGGIDNRDPVELIFTKAGGEKEVEGD